MDKCWIQSLIELCVVCNKMIVLHSFMFLGNIVV